MDRTWMAALREGKGLTLNAMARVTGCSEKLLYILERGIPQLSTTIPELAVEIGKAYGMTEAQVLQITNEAALRRMMEKRGRKKSAYSRLLALLNAQ